MWRRLFYNIEEVKEFQKIILDVIGESGQGSEK